MPSEGGRRGRRDNGLDAAAFVPLVDVDPRVGEHLLDVLASAGVPAFLEPSADIEPYTRTLSLPSPPTDRLWVDRDQRREAREIVDAETPYGTRPAPTPRDDEPSRGLSDVDEERAWKDIVSAWDAPAVEPTRPTRRSGEPDTDAGGRRRGTDGAAGGSDSGGRRGGPGSSAPDGPGDERRGGISSADDPAGAGSAGDGAYPRPAGPEHDGSDDPDGGGADRTADAEGPGG